jgi:hypothetical protein
MIQEERQLLEKFNYKAHNQYDYKAYAIKILIALIQDIDSHYLAIKYL